MIRLIIAIITHSIINQEVSEPAPITIGKGPIIIIPLLTESLPSFKAEAATTNMIPTKIKAIPAINNSDNLSEAGVVCALTLFALA